MHEVDPQAPERDAEAGEPGERRLLRRPVEPVRPVGDELAEVAEVGAERPAGVLGRVRPARRAQPRAEVLERRGAVCGVNGSGWASGMSAPYKQLIQHAVDERSGAVQQPFDPLLDIPAPAPV